MGIFGRIIGFNQAPKNGVQGTAEVVSASLYRGKGVKSQVDMELDVQAAGLATTRVSYRGLAHRKRWPEAGMRLPVVVDPLDPNQIRIDWGAIQESG